MPINLDAVGHSIEPRTVKWTAKDTTLYALAVGCGSSDLQYTTESSIGVTPCVLPTFAVTAYDVPKLLLPALGDYNPAALVHGTQSMTFHRPLEQSGRAIVSGGISHIDDKGSGALIGMWTRAIDAHDQTPLFDLLMEAFLIGEGGWSGERSKKGLADIERPDREPDAVVSHRTRADQALLYRLTSDLNPLHSDPVFAARSGFPKPILHGLCTLGIAGRHLLRILCNDDAVRLRHLSARFAAPVVPGDLLECSVWRIASGEAAFEVAVEGRPVIKHGLCRFDYRLNQESPSKADGDRP